MLFRRLLSAKLPAPSLWCNYHKRPFAAIIPRFRDPVAAVRLQAFGLAISSHTSAAICG
jgi:hypothetical protein